MTIKGPQKTVEVDSHELETIRPYRMKPTPAADTKPAVAPKSHVRKPSQTVPRQRSPVKAQNESKFVIPSNPALMYREPSGDDYSDLFVDTDIVFDRRLNIIKVSILCWCL